MMGLIFLAALPLAFLLIGDGDDDPDNAPDTGPDPDPDTDPLKNDVKVGGPAANSLSGGGGNDLLAGFRGDDSLNGGAGMDLLDGGEGNDLLTGDAGDDLLIGASGRDTLLGGNGLDWLVDGPGNDSLSGGADNDLIDAVGGFDTLIGDGGDDFLSAIDPYPERSAAMLVGVDREQFTSVWDENYGARATPGLRAAILRDIETGEEGVSPDLLFGNDGDDVLIGDAGDTLTGGAGADFFVRFIGPEPGQQLVVTDFDPAEDTLEISVFSPDSLEPSFAPDAAGTGTLVSYDGAVVAWLQNLAPDDLLPDSVQIFNRPAA
jgi:Ca2+-binding RTX toxin-like protein